MTIAGAHQPNFLPWFGFFDKVQRVDRFIFMDGVSLNRKSVTHRVKILGQEGPVWATLPVLHTGDENVPIVEARIGNDDKSLVKLCNLLRSAYRHSPGWGDVGERVLALVRQPGHLLAEVNLALIEVLAGVLGVGLAHSVRQSDLHGLGAKSELLSTLLVEVGVDTYLSGGFPPEHAMAFGTAADYNDPDVFAASGISLEYQCYRQPHYRQRADEFFPGLSALDAVMWLGADAARELFQTGGSSAG